MSDHESLRQTRDIGVGFWIAGCVLLVLMPLSLIQRYRMGTARRTARGWLATANVVAMSLSAVLFMAAAAFSRVAISSRISCSRRRRA